MSINIAVDSHVLRQSPNPLASAYSRFDVAGSRRTLLTGHSHQAWPDVAREGVLAAFDDAAADVDEKWERAFAQADLVRAYIGGLLGEPDAQIALGGSAHEMLVRLLSALPLTRRPRLVTTDGEFHSARRQLDRLAEAGLDVEIVPAYPVSTLAERLAAAIDERTSAVLVSAVLFETSSVVPGLDALAAHCERLGAELVIDVYHALGPIDWTIPGHGVERAWIVGGGYKYLQLGEGVCWMRLPAHSDELRPVVTGWQAEFGMLDADHAAGGVWFGTGAERWAGSTYDPTSHYRAARVARFFADVGLTPALLHASYRHQLERLEACFASLDLPPALIAVERESGSAGRGGFLALRTPHAARIRRDLLDRGVLTDSRGNHLRLGPAPYLSDAQLESAVGVLGDVVRALDIAG